MKLEPSPWLRNFNLCEGSFPALVTSDDTDDDSCHISAIPRLRTWLRTSATRRWSRPPQLSWRCPAAWPSWRTPASWTAASHSCGRCSGPSCRRRRWCRWPPVLYVYCPLIGQCCALINVNRLPICQFCAPSTAYCPPIFYWSILCSFCALIGQHIALGCGDSGLWHGPGAQPLLQHELDAGPGQDIGTVLSSIHTSVTKCCDSRFTKIYSIQNSMYYCCIYGDENKA